MFALGEFLAQQQQLWERREVESGERVVEPLPSQNLFAELPGCSNRLQTALQVMIH